MKPCSIVTQADSVHSVAEPRSIILAVISAKNDLANQIVLKMAREADPTGNRTMGEQNRHHLDIHLDWRLRYWLTLPQASSRSLTT